LLQPSFQTPKLSPLCSTQVMTLTDHISYPLTETHIYRCFLLSMAAAMFIKMLEELKQIMQVKPESQSDAQDTGCWNLWQELFLEFHFIYFDVWNVSLHTKLSFVLPSILWCGTWFNKYQNKSVQRTHFKALLFELMTNLQCQFHCKFTYFKIQDWWTDCYVKKKHCSSFSLLLCDRLFSKRQSLNAGSVKYKNIQRSLIL